MDLETTDLMLGSAYIICVCVGLIGNILSLRYFLSRHRDIANQIYIAMTVTDCIVCSTVFPVIASFFNGRNATIFGNAIFCHVWGILWKVLPYYTIFLVAMLSSTRTVILLNRQKSINKKLGIITITVYAGYLIARITVPVILQIGAFLYAKRDVYCWQTTDLHWYEEFTLILYSVEMALPILPILISSIISTIVIRSAMKASQKRMLSQHNSQNPLNTFDRTSSSVMQNIRRTRIEMKRKATVTILIVTAVYLVLNIPVFINYILYTVLIEKGFVYPDPYYTSSFMFNYSWNFSYVFLVTLNATINPIVYFSRMKQFRESLVFRKPRDPAKIVI